MSGEPRRDPLSGRLVVIAPARADRPGAPRPELRPPSAEELDSCPFCEGREQRTPPESLALGRPEGAPPDSPGWRVRVVPNLYPALERQEVVVHSPRHLRSVAELADDQLALVAEAWRCRAAAARADGFAYLHALVNEGAAAGASLSHSHSQLVWLREAPPAVVAEQPRNGCGVCSLLAREECVVLERDGLRLVSAWAGRGAYELLLAPIGEEADPFAGELLPPALALLAEAIRRLHGQVGPCPLNAWLHADGGHWHVEVLPRLSVMAGIELGAGIWINSVAPELAAAALRDD